MTSNFEVIKQMRESIIFEGLDFDSYLEINGMPFYRNHMKKLWKRACGLIEEDQWRMFLCNKMSNALGEFRKTINQLYEEGISETDIASTFGVDIHAVTSMLW